ncbi:MAG: hypothetical protein COY66_01620 [Candidatus Kerfeldbacteria bacterium CG_4_10_14_0_8_um_filter_42_10]|uniref:O-antigen ligase-related domain-containing protein n=1 Tax=Candidatus Kerfeldbacteria bacterium CG_4_10_14_0_8_um_filter_42_10 TaxID=2014248 RepID=A0A2M7RJT3_9BACT|nr:MAG: hypothetical protein COY66_01620 [Candidatus Kerfeldbacteria bacterium CG_4_10_14_0_8_um_filter_42_10]
MNPQKIIYFLIGSLGLILPLFLNTTSDNEFTFNKTYLFQLIILISAAFLFFTWNQFSEMIKKCWNSFRLTFLVLVFYFGVLVVSTIFSISPQISFWGGGRQQGLMQFLFYLIFFFVVLLIKPTKKKIIQLLYFICGVSFLVSTFGILEYFKIRPFPFPVYDSGVASTLGHPSFLGAYLIMVLPITIGLFCISSLRLIRYILGITFVFQLIVLYLTETRAAWLAFGLSLFLALILFLLKREKVTALIALFILLLGSFVFLIQSGYLSKIDVLETGSGALRITWWEDAVKAIQKRPIIGYGLETQEDVLMPYFNSGQILAGRVDRAHNEILDDLLTTGILGAVSFFIFVGLVFKDGIDHYFKSKDRERRIISLALLTGLAAYFIQGMFSFSVTILYVYFWLLAGMVVVLARGEKEADKQDLPVCLLSQATDRSATR